MATRRSSGARSGSRTTSAPKGFAVVNRSTGKGVVFVKKTPPPQQYKRIKSSTIA